MGAAIRMRDPSRPWAVDVYRPFWEKEREAGVWGLLGEAGSSHVDRKKSKRVINKIPAAAPRNTGAQRGLPQTCFARFLPSCPFSC